MVWLRTFISRTFTFLESVLVGGSTPAGSMLYLSRLGNTSRVIVTSPKPAVGLSFLQPGERVLRPPPTFSPAWTHPMTTQFDIEFMDKWGISHD